MRDPANQGKDWGKLGFLERLQIVNYWIIFYLLSDFMILSGTLIFLFIEDKDIKKAEILIGFGCCLCWCSLPAYLHQTSRYSLINRTIAYTLPTVFRAMTGVIPLFMGFAFLGLCFFWDSYRFHSISYSMFSLFAMMQGDSLLDQFYDISAFRYLAACLFIFIFVFIGVV